MSRSSPSPPPPSGLSEAAPPPLPPFSPPSSPSSGGYHALGNQSLPALFKAHACLVAQAGFRVHAAAYRNVSESLRHNERLLRGIAGMSRGMRYSVHMRTTLMWDAHCGNAARVAELIAHGSVVRAVDAFWRSVRGCVHECLCHAPHPSHFCGVAETNNCTHVSPPPRRLVSGLPTQAVSWCAPRALESVRGLCAHQPLMQSVRRGDSRAGLIRRRCWMTRWCARGTPPPPPHTRGPSAHLHSRPHPLRLVETGYDRCSARAPSTWQRIREFLRGHVLRFDSPADCNAPEARKLLFLERRTRHARLTPGHPSTQTTTAPPLRPTAALSRAPRPRAVRIGGAWASPRAQIVGMCTHPHPLHSLRAAF